MELTDTTQALLSARKAKGASFADPGAAIGRDGIRIAALMYGQASALPEEAKGWLRRWDRTRRLHRN